MFKKLFANKWLKWSLIGFGLFIVFWLVYFYLTFFTNLWVYFPGNPRFQAAFSRLQLSCQQYPYNGMCKGHCGYERERYHRAIADYLNKDDAGIAYGQVKKAILNEKNSDCFRIELIDSIHLSQENKNPGQETINPSQYLIDYLVKKDADKDVSQEIVRVYGKSVFSGTLSQKLLQEATDPAVNCDVKSNAIENLGRYGDDEITRPIFQKLIEENKDPDHLWIGYEASKMLSAPNHKDRKFVKWCEDVIFSGYNKYVKEQMVDVLNYYKNRNPEEKKYILGILKKVYFDKSQDKFVRNESADLLHYALGRGSEKLYPNPKISSEEFDEHYIGFPKFPQYCR
jgi:hypothetical protein